jgi:hypothetical protein
MCFGTCGEMGRRLRFDTHAGFASMDLHVNAWFMHRMTAYWPWARDVMWLYVFRVLPEQRTHFMNI